MTSPTKKATPAAQGSAALQAAKSAELTADRAQDPDAGPEWANYDHQNAYDRRVADES